MFAQSNVCAPEPFSVNNFNRVRRLQSLGFFMCWLMLSLVVQFRRFLGDVIRLLFPVVHRDPGFVAFCFTRWLFPVVHMDPGFVVFFVTRWLFPVVHPDRGFIALYVQQSWEGPHLKTCLLVIFDVDNKNLLYKILPAHFIVGSIWFYGRIYLCSVTRCACTEKKENL